MWKNSEESETERKRGENLRLMTDYVQFAALEDLKELLRAGDITMDQWVHGVAGVSKLMEKYKVSSPQIPNKEEKRKPSGPSPRQNAEARRQKSLATSGPVTREGTTGIGPLTPLPKDKTEDSQGSPTGVELFSEGCMKEEPERMELQIETETYSNNKYLLLYDQLMGDESSEGEEEAVFNGKTMVAKMRMKLLNGRTTAAKMKMSGT